MRIHRGIPCLLLLLVAACGSPSAQHAAAPTQAHDNFPTFATFPVFASATAEPPAPAAAPPPAAPLTGRGSITWYLPAGLPSACGPVFADTDFVAAVSGALWTAANRNDDPLCGRIMIVTDTADHTSVTVRVEDLCPSCDTDRIELSGAAFAQLADPGNGVVPATWQTGAGP